MQVRRGRKWNAQEETGAGTMQTGQTFLRCMEPQLIWSNEKERKHLVVAEVMKTEKERNKIKAASQGKLDSVGEYHQLGNHLG